MEKDQNSDLELSRPSFRDEASAGKDLRRTASGVVLVPQPTDSPADPLNWPMWKKVLNLSIVSLAAFIGITQALANQSGFFAQAKVYHKTPVQISYSVGIQARILLLGAVD